MIKRIAPELVLALHFGFVLFAVFGGFLAFVDARWLWVHAPAVIWSAVVSFIAYKIVDLLLGLRVTEEEEREGLDITSHGETAYNR